MSSKYLLPYFLLAWLVTILHLQQLLPPSHPMQQITGTSSATLDASSTPTFTTDPRETLAVTATVTLPITNTSTVTPTTELTATATIQPTVTPAAPTLPTPTPLLSQTLPPPSASPVWAEGSPTATFIPLPTFTMIFPEPTASQFLLSSERQPDDPDLAKGNTNSFQEQILPLGFFLTIVLLWLVLVVWFIFVRRQAQ